MFRNKKEDLYKIFVTELAHAEDLRWSRFNSFMLINSILFLSLVALMKDLFSCSSNPYISVLTFLICIVGFWGGISFSLLGARSSKYLNYYFDVLRKYDRKYLDDLDQPYERIQHIRKEAEKGIKKISSSRNIVTFGPLIFTLIYSFVIIFVICKVYLCLWMYLF